MEKEKLIIKNFGPIKSVELDLGRFTILIGEQATGKSTGKRRNTKPIHESKN